MLSHHLRLIAATCCGAFIAAKTQAKIEFNRDIRPILSDTCFHCHGFDEKERKSGLRIDVRDDALKPAKSGAVAIVPGQPDKSELVKRVMTTDEDDLMPPTKLHKPLTPEQKNLLKQWIAEGAEYQGHWAFITPVTPEIPKVKTAVVSTVDAFILARLEKEGLKPSPAADKETLIRRVTLDLTGLPPTPEEVDAFNNDSSPQAYEHVVDRLLSSKHYGEAMAMQWLDYARYADSNGFQADGSRTMWPWRDWVIKAFNDNMSFDRFTIEQIAGDLVPNATRDQIVATGFNRNHRINGEGGLIPEEWRIENIIDRVETTSFTWLGLTLNCCRCHDHKFDPFTQRDFYSFFAFYNNVKESGTLGENKDGNSEPYISAPGIGQGEKLAAAEANLKVAEQQLTETNKQLPKFMAEWEATLRKQGEAESPRWEKLVPGTVTSEGGATLTAQADGAYLASGPNPASDTYVLMIKMPAAQVSAFLLEVFPDPSLPTQSIGRAPNGSFVLSEFEIFVKKADNTEPVKIPLARVEAEYSQQGYDIKNLLAPAEGKGWAVDAVTLKQPRKALFVPEIPLESGAKVIVKMKQQAIAQHNIGRFRLSASTQPAAQLALNTKTALSSVRAILDKPEAERTPAQKAELEKVFRASVAGPVKQAEDAHVHAKKAKEETDKMIPTSMVMKELDKPRDAFILTRGEYDKPGEKVNMATPVALPPMPPGTPLNRLGLAMWIVDPQNPLTARVWVNRIWSKFFGTGLCKTTENLGTQSEWPSHPEFLDWMATEFIRMKWDMKAFQKMIVMSATYRQSSKITKDLLERDPENRLLARGPRFRLTGEIVRDQALAVSGLLVPKIGGPSVRPYMPEGVWDETSKYGDLRGYKHATDDGLYRRSFYTIWKRTAAPPTMTIFDAPTREICTIKRSRTNTPLQALALLNEVTFTEASRALAEKMMKQGGGMPEQRIAYGYKCATAHTIDDASLKTLLKGLNDRMNYFKSNAEDARKLIAQGESKPDAKLDPVELAAYTTSAEILLNLDRVVARD
ncbi:MAG: PSD1 and planctomycete cytochrome C domain-containing protein [Verrucomicrobiaceae bacterium]